MAEDAKKSTTANDGRSIPLWQAVEYLLDGSAGLTRSYRERRRRYDPKKNDWLLGEIERRGACIFGVDKTSDKRVTIEPAGLSVSYKIVYWHAADRRPIPRLQTRSTLRPTIIDHVYVEREPLIAKTEGLTLTESVLLADTLSGAFATGIDETANVTEMIDANITSAPVEGSPERKVGRPSLKKLIHDEIERREAPPLNQTWKTRRALAGDLYTWLKANPTLQQMKNVDSVERALNKHKLWPRLKKAKL